MDHLRRTRSLEDWQHFCNYEFIHDQATQIHPCIKGEILLSFPVELEDIRKFLPVVMLLEEVASLIRTHCSSEWLEEILQDVEHSFKKSIITRIQHNATARLSSYQFGMCPGETVEDRYMWYYFENDNIERLRVCIEEGDGTPLALPDDIMFSVSVREYEEFSYKEGVFPPYGKINGHWYLMCHSAITTRSTAGPDVRFLSFITDSKYEIKKCLRSCNIVFLNYVPPFKPSGAEAGGLLGVNPQSQDHINYSY